jgi:putative solute:sodium symporter small subunit
LPDPSTSGLDARIAASHRRYWRANLHIMAVLLSVWAVVGLGCGILFADLLNAVQLGGFPLGFWFAQQGSIATFVLLILVYAILLNRLDRRHLAELAELRRQRPPADAGPEAGA